MSFDREHGALGHFVRRYLLFAASIVVLASESLHAQAKLRSVTPRVNALLHVVRTETLDTVVAWMLVDSASLRSVARLSNAEFSALARNLGPRTSFLDAASDAVCPAGSESRCLALEVNAVVYERKSWFFRQTVRNAAPGACGLTVRLYQVGFSEGSPVTLAHEDAAWGDCAPPRRPPSDGSSPSRSPWRD